MSERSVKRKTLVAREDLTKRISEMAKRRGYSLYDMVNEAFELTVKAEDSGVNLRNAVEEHEVLKTAKEARLHTVPGKPMVRHGCGECCSF